MSRTSWPARSRVATTAYGLGGRTALPFLSNAAPVDPRGSGRVIIPEKTLGGVTVRGFGDAADAGAPMRVARDITVIEGLVRRAYEARVTRKPGKHDQLLMDACLLEP